MSRARAEPAGCRMVPARPGDPSGRGVAQRLRRSSARGVLAIVLMVASLAAAGCASAMLAPRIVTAPNAGGRSSILFNQSPETRVALARLYARTLRVPVTGPPTAEIAVAVLEPGDYRHSHSVTVQPDARGQPNYHVDSHWEPLSEGTPQIAPRGTIVLLHGFWVAREAVLHWGLRLAEAGYRTVLVDLRGHGASTGPWATFGALEVGDLMQVLDALEREGLAEGAVGVLGVSYGAAVALQWAGRDPRVRAVVALESFADARLAVRQYTRAVLTVPSATERSPQPRAGPGDWRVFAGSPSMSPPSSADSGSRCFSSTARPTPSSRPSTAAGSMPWPRPAHG